MCITLIYRTELLPRCCVRHTVTIAFWINTHTHTMTMLLCCASLCKLPGKHLRYTTRWVACTGEHKNCCWFRHRQMTAGGIKVARVELSKHVDCIVAGADQARLSWAECQTPPQRTNHICKLALSDGFWQLWPSSIDSLDSDDDMARVVPGEQCILSLSILTKFLEKDLEQSKPFAVAIELCINLLLAAGRNANCIVDLVVGYFVVASCPSLSHEAFCVGVAAVCGRGRVPQVVVLILSCTDRLLRIVGALITLHLLSRHSNFVTPA